MMDDILALKQMIIPIPLPCRESLYPHRQSFGTQAHDFHTELLSSSIFMESKVLTVITFLPVFVQRGYRRMLCNMSISFV